MSADVPPAAPRTVTVRCEAATVHVPVHYTVVDVPPVAPRTVTVRCEDATVRVPVHYTVAAPRS
jgi:hypothetical protein